MSYSEYNGSKSKVSHAVGRIFRNAQENIRGIGATKGSVKLGSLFKSISTSSSSSSSMRSLKSHHRRHSFGSEQLTTTSSPTENNLFEAAPHLPHSTSSCNKFGLQRIRQGFGCKGRCNNNPVNQKTPNKTAPKPNHADLLGNDNGSDDDCDDDSPKHLSSPNKSIEDKHYYEKQQNSNQFAKFS